MDELWTNAHWVNKANWVSHVKRSLGKRSKLTDKQIKDYFTEHVQHDPIRPPTKQNRPYYAPIYSKQGGAYQFDIWDQNAHFGESAGVLPYFLIALNINTKKAYQYGMNSAVRSALNKFWSDAPDCKTMVSDQDSAFLANDTVGTFKQKGIKLTTTIDSDHHTLGPINRLMRTLRDQRGQERGAFTKKDMERQVDIYNNNRHSAIRTAPNEMTPEKEREFIARAEKKQTKVKDYTFKVGDTVRHLLPKSTNKTDKRNNWSMETYKIIQRNGRSFIIQAKNGSTDTVPGFELRPEKDVKRYPHGDVIKNDKRAPIETVKDYYKPERSKVYHYKVRFEGMDKDDEITEREMRESRPTQLSLEEKRYWVKKAPDYPKGIPQRIKNMVPKINSGEELHF
jgi:hypothetical protein